MSHTARQPIPLQGELVPGMAGYSTVVGSDYVYDFSKNKSQEAVNAEVDTALESKASVEFVNSSIATATAEFKGTFNSVAQLPSTGVDANDYAFVISVDEAGNRLYNRYKYNTTSGWVFEYSLNNSGFTAGQWATISSGITSADKTKLDALPTNADLTTALNAKANANDVYTKANTYTKTETGTLVTDAINALDSSQSATSSDSKVSVTVSETNGKLTNVSVSTSDIASAKALSDEVIRATTAEQTLTTKVNNTYTKTEVDTKIENMAILGEDDGEGVIPEFDPQVDCVLKTEYNTTVNAIETKLDNTYSKTETYSKEQLNNLITTPSQNYVTLTSEDDLPTTGSSDTIYRVAGTNSYKEFAWDGSDYVKLDEKNPGIDDEPTAGSENLVKSGGVNASINNSLYYSELFTISDTRIDKTNVQYMNIDFTGKIIASTSEGRYSGYSSVSAGEVYKIKLVGEQTYIPRCIFCSELPQENVQGVLLSNDTVFANSADVISDEFIYPVKENGYLVLSWYYSFVDGTHGFYKVFKAEEQKESKVSVSSTKAVESNAIYNIAGNVSILNNVVPFTLGSYSGATSGSAITYSSAANRIRIELPTENLFSIKILDSNYAMIGTIYQDIIPSSKRSAIITSFSSNTMYVKEKVDSITSFTPNRVIVVIKATDDRDLSNLTDISNIIKLIPIKQTSTKIVSLYGGALGYSTGYYTSSNSAIIGYYHTPRFIHCEYPITIKTLGLTGRVIYYDHNQNYVNYSNFDTNENSATISPKNYNVAYIRLSITSAPASTKTIELNGVWDGINDEKFQRNTPNNDGYQNVSFIVDVDTCEQSSNDTSQITKQYTRSYNFGMLHLPDNYKEDGEPTKLIIYLHGAAERYTISSTAFPDNVGLKEEWNKLGYAQLDVDMIPALYNYTGTGSSGTDDDTECVTKAYNWVINHFNIARDGVYLIGRSRGAYAVLQLLANYNPVKLPVICAISNAGANTLINYGLFRLDSDAMWQLFCNSHGLPTDNRPTYNSTTYSNFISQSEIVNFLRDNINIWWKKATIPFNLIVENKSEHQTPLEIFDLLVSSYSASSNKGKSYIEEFLNKCKANSPVPLRFDWCYGDTTQSWESTSYGNYSSAGKDLFVNNIYGGNAEYRRWPSCPSGTNGHFHENYNKVDGEYILPNGVIVENPSMACVEWITWCQQHDKRFLDSYSY